MSARINMHGQYTRSYIHEKYRIRCQMILQRQIKDICLRFDICSPTRSTCHIEFVWTQVSFPTSNKKLHWHNVISLISYLNNLCFLVIERFVLWGVFFGTVRLWSTYIGTCVHLWLLRTAVALTQTRWIHLMREFETSQNFPLFS